MKKNCLHCLIKEISQQKSRKLKIVCDWDEVIQPLVPYLYYQNSQIAESISNDLIFSNEYLEDFWKKELVGFRDHSCYFIDENLNKEIKKIKDNSDLYIKSPFLSPAKELLLALKDDLIEGLSFLSAYNQDTLPKGDQRKIDKFQVTFGQFSQCNFELTPFSSKGIVPLKWQLIQKYNPDFDLFIDDNPNIIKSAQENLSEDKLFVLPDYKYNRHIQGSNFYHIKTSVSFLKEENFVEFSQESQKKQAQDSLLQLESNQNQQASQILQTTPPKPN